MTDSQVSETSWHLIELATQLPSRPNSLLLASGTPSRYINYTRIQRHQNLLLKLSL